MNVQEDDAREVRAETESLIITEINGGYRVHTATSPARIFHVNALPEQPECTCEEFVHRREPGWRCAHILAVERHLDNEDARYEAAERAAIRTEARRNGGAKRGDARVPDTEDANPTHMTLKRSVSPDGRIDSLSVEFSCPVTGAPVTEITSRALTVLWLQSSIVGSFLQKSSGKADTVASEGMNGGMPARLLEIGGMDTRYGRRMFLNFQVNGDLLKFFGSRKKLAEAITASGHPQLAEHIEEGVELNVPCRVVTKPSEDGRYVNVTRVMPQGRSRRG